ncbi:hypothetical protein IEO21_06750 [Rhodonia placenta]|uniref:Uncharacterized protein n=1 Tax=Rhodonia placenta TaxID=104341 RepID=A0A8H7NZU2_9APHY|nr:hypothetical protein IEO21_06750 [Postia placenta]
MTITLSGRCALVLRRLNAAALLLETSKRIPVTRIYTSAQQTNFGRGKWWNTVLSDQHMATGILWTLSALVDVCGPTQCMLRCFTPGCRPGPVDSCAGQHTAASRLANCLRLRGTLELGEGNICSSNI